MKKSLMSLSLLIALLLAALPGVMAQEELSEEEQAALFDRAVAALETYYGYNSYTIDVLQSETQTMTINLGEESQDRSSVESLTGTFNVIRDTQNISGTFVIELSNTEDEVATANTVEGEMRYVDGVLYVNAAYTAGDTGTAPVIPEGWHVVEDIENDPIFGILDIQDTLDNFSEERQASNIEMFNALRDQVLSISVEEDTMSDETPVETITISLDRNALLTMMSFGEEEAPAEIIAMYQTLPEGEEVAQLIMAIDAEGNVLGLADITILTFTDLDLATLVTDAPEGSTFSLTQESVEVQEFTAVNPELEPATAPEVAE